MNLLQHLNEEKCVLTQTPQKTGISSQHQHGTLERRKTNFENDWGFGKEETGTERMGRKDYADQGNKGTHKVVCELSQMRTHSKFTGNTSTLSFSARHSFPSCVINSKNREMMYQTIVLSSSTSRLLQRLDATQTIYKAWWWSVLAIS